ncbi:MAG: pilus assembly protein [Deltaproteobacteria bacterium]|nr:pilus assembly protein [Deltaproteobacteria bacterium]
MMRRSAERSAGRSEKGQSLVEFSLVLPIFLFLLVGIAEFGRAWMTRNILTGAAREAVRIAAVQGNSSSATARANNILSSAGINGASVVLNDDGTAYGTCAATVSYNFPLAVAGFLPGLSGTSIPLSSSTSMRKEF